MIFAKKRYVLFVGKTCIDSGLVVLKSEPVFYGNEAIPYTKETLPQALRQARSLSKSKKIRVVLSEELVYVTEVSFSAGTLITRTLVAEKAQASIPEDLRETDWDFQTLQYTEKQKNKDFVAVQVAVVEKVFSQSFHQALQEVPLLIESIVPESSVLASLEREAAEVSVIVAADRESIVFCAVESGFVLTTCVKRGGDIEKDLSEFLLFVGEKSEEKIKRIIFSHCGEAPSAFLEKFSGAGYECIERDYNPLIGAALQTNISGRDEDTLNIADAFLSVRKHVW